MLWEEEASRLDARGTRRTVCSWGSSAGLPQSISHVGPGCWVGSRAHVPRAMLTDVSLSMKQQTQAHGFLLRTMLNHFQIESAFYHVACKSNSSSSLLNHKWISIGRWTHHMEFQFQREEKWKVASPLPVYIYGCWQPLLSSAARQQNLRATRLKRPPVLSWFHSSCPTFQEAITLERLFSLPYRRPLINLCFEWTNDVATIVWIILETGKSGLYEKELLFSLELASELTDGS